MASELATAFVRVRPDLTGFKAEAQKGTREAGAALGKVFALAFGGVAAEELARHVVTVAATQDAMFARIKQLTKSAGAQWDVYGSTVQEQIIKKSESSGFAVDQLANAYGRLIQQTKDSGLALKYLTTASDVARARGTAVTMVATSLSRAYAGNAQALSRLGIIVPKYTAEQDAIKTKLHEVAVAETIAGQQRAKNYQGTNLANAAEQRYAALTKVQLSQIKENLKGELKAAAARDKLTGATKTLAEVQARFKGQGAIFGQTAAGEADRFSISVHELEVSLGEHMIPLLGRAAEQGRLWAQELGHSATAGHAAEAVAQNIAAGVRNAANAIQAIYPAIKLSAEAISTVVGGIGAGPLLLTYAAYKGLVVIVGLYAKAERELIAVKRVLTGTAKAEAGAQNGATAAAARAAEAAQVQAGALTELTAALSRANTAQLRYTGSAAIGTTATEVETGAIVGEGTAAVTSAGETGLLSGALAGLGTGGILFGIAAVAGGIYWLSTRTTEAERNTRHLIDAYATLNNTRKNLATTQGDIGAAGQAVISSRIAREQAAAQLRSAREQLDKDSSSAHASLDKIRTDQLNVAQAADQWRQANRTLIASEQAKSDVVKKNTQLIKDEKTGVNDLIASELKLAHSTPTQLAGEGRGYAIKVATGDWKAFAASLDKVAQDTAHVSAAQRFGAARLADYTRQIQRMPSDKVITLTLNDAAFYKKLRQAESVIGGAAHAFFDALTKPPTSPGSRGDFATPVESKVRHELPAIMTNALSQGAAAAGPNIAQETAKALRDGVIQAKQSLTSIGGTLGSDIASVLDAQLAAGEAKLAASPAAQMVKQLTADAARLQARISGRDATAQIDTTLKTLNDLKAAFGPGAHTADQDAQLAAATNAYLDAQDSQRIGADQIQAQGLSDQIDAQKAAMEKRNQAEKDAAQRRINDLGDELNRGLITEKQYVTRLNASLRREGVNYKAAGRLLGIAFADGFKEQLQGILDQAKAIAKLTPAQRGPGTGGAPDVVDPLKLAAEKHAELTKQAATTAARNGPDSAHTAALIAELRKLGAIVKESKTEIKVSYPVGTPKKKAAHIREIAAALGAPR